jgi:hypothetical protein
MLAAPGLAGCFHADVVRVRPGHIDVRTPPSDPTVERSEWPRDPGERYLVLSPGGFVGGGVAFENAQTTRAAGAVGAEVGLHFGTREVSHAEDDFLFYPQRAYGLNVGYEALSQEGTQPGIGYLEAQYTDTPWGAAVGWALDMARAQNGPQATFFAGPLYARMTHLDGGRTEVTAGLFFKVPYSWVWAR